MHLTKAQKALFNKWMDVTRFVYNCAVAAVNKGAVGVVLKDLRALFVKDGCPFLCRYPWVKENCPYDVRDEAIRDLCKNFKTNMARCKNCRSHHFRLHFQRKRAQTGSMAFLTKHWNAQNSVYYRTTMKKAMGAGATLRIQFSEPLPSLRHDGRVVKENGHFYLVVNQTVRMPICSPENQRAVEGKRRVVSIDPGVRTFMTCYDPKGEIVEFGCGDVKRLTGLRASIQDLVDKQAKTNHRRRYRLQRAINRLRVKMRNVIADTHYRVSKWLAKNYESILLPRMDVRRMVKKEGRRLNGTGASNLLVWSHCKFYDRLMQQCERMGSRVVECTEEYTSQTCGKCGVLNKCLGSSKTFVCGVEGCGYEIDRDFNGARNILLKAATENKTF